MERRNNRKHISFIVMLAAAMLLSANIKEVHADSGPAKIPRTLVSEAVADTNGRKVITWDAIPEYSGQGYVDINDDVPFFKDEEMTAEGYERYGSLDMLGRCTTAMACVGPETMPTEERAERLSEVTPTGWCQAKYAGIEKGFLYHRCHLIGYQLTGENANEQNLITGTQYMNVEGMLPFENSVAEYVRGTGNHVLYRVTPVFKGEELVCRGVLMEACSVEDPLVRFCVFCYNVQPGIEIDYTTGRSREADSLENGDGEEEQEFVLNTRTKKFHSPDCPSVKKMSAKNKKTVQTARDELIRDGYKPCGACGGK